MTRAVLVPGLRAAGLLLLGPSAAVACPVCFGAADGPMLQGSNMGILALLLVTLTMLVAFGAFFWTLSRRATDASRRESMTAQATQGAQS